MCKILFIIIFSSQLLSQTSKISTQWTPNEEVDLSHYVIYRDVTSGTLVPLDTIPKTESTYDDFSVEIGQVYYYNLTAVDSAGNESMPSDELIIDLIDNKAIRNFKWTK